MADEQITSNTANIPYINVIDQGADQASPAAGRAILYVKNGGVYVRASSAAPVSVGGSVALANGQLAVGNGSGILSALPVGTEGQLVRADASGHAAWATVAAGGGASYPDAVSQTAAGWTAYSGSVPVLATSANQAFFFYTSRSPNAQNDSLTYRVNVRTGTYSLRVLHSKQSVCAISTITLGGVAVGDLDAYSASALYNQVATFTGIAVTTDGPQDLVFTAATRNASATAWHQYLTHFTLWRTA